MFDFEEPNVNFLVPDLCGVYYIYGKPYSNGFRPLLFIGSAGSRLKDKILEHLSNQDIPGAHSFNFNTFETEKEAQKVESLHIAALQPHFNVRSRLVKRFVNQ